METYSVVGLEDAAGYGASREESNAVLNGRTAGRLSKGWSAESSFVEAVV